MRYSVIIPCHNSAEFVVDALQSIADQELAADEVIVIDDASTDDTIERVRETGIATTILEANFRSAAATRNLGVRHASGDFIAFLDADNQWLPDHLSRATTLLKSGDDGLYVTPPLPSVDGPLPQRGVLRDDFPLAADATGLTRDTFVHWRLTRSWGFPTTGSVVRRSIMERVGGFDESQINRHDFELVMRLICHTTWCASPVATWWSRPPRAGDISSNTVRCAYFAFRALTLNEAAYASPAYSRLLRQSALNAVKTAALGGRADELAAARILAKKHLGLIDHLKLGIYRATPAAFRHHLHRRASLN